MEVDDDVFSAIKPRDRPAPRLPDGFYPGTSDLRFMDPPDTFQKEQKAFYSRKASMPSLPQAPVTGRLTDDSKQILSARPRPKLMDDWSLLPSFDMPNDLGGKLYSEANSEPEQEDGLRSHMNEYVMNRSQIQDLESQNHDKVDSIDAVTKNIKEKSQAFANEEWKATEASGFCACSTKWEDFREDMEVCFLQIEEMINLHREYFNLHAPDGLPLLEPAMEKRVLNHSILTFNKLEHLRAQFHELAIPMAPKQPSFRRNKNDDVTSDNGGKKSVRICRDGGSTCQSRRIPTNLGDKQEQTIYPMKAQPGNEWSRRLEEIKRSLTAVIIAKKQHGGQSEPSGENTSTFRDSCMQTEPLPISSELFNKRYNQLLHRWNSGSSGPL